MLTLLLLLSTPTGDSSRLPESRCPVAERVGAHLGVDPWSLESACRAEERLLRAGWSDAWVQGALINAWHESGWNPSAVGDSGHAVGFWQLRDDGLGRGMGDLRLDVRVATSAVVRSARRQRMDVSGRDPEEATRQFCQLIMRPSDKHLKGELRARLSARISDE